MRFTLFCSLFVLSLFTAHTHAQTELVTLKWNDYNKQSGSELTSFEGCGFIQLGKVVIPTYYNHLQVNNPSANLSISDLKYEINKEGGPLDRNAIETFSPKQSQYITQEAGAYFVNIELFPFRVNPENNQLERLVSFRYALNYSGSVGTPKSKMQKADFKTNSVLAKGDWHRFSISETGVYKITLNDLTKQKIDPSSIDFSSFQVFSSSGRIIAEPIADDRTDDLEELPIKVMDGNNNNRLDGDDFILFFAEGPHNWFYDESLRQYIHEYNFYENQNYVFLTHSQTNGKRISDVSSGQGQSYEHTIDEYHHLAFHEVDLVNFIASGRTWFGESFGKNTQQTFKNSFSNVRVNDTAYLRQRFVGRSIGGNSSYSIDVNGANWLSGSFSPVSGIYDDPFVDRQYTDVTRPFVMQNSNADISYNFYPISSASDAWLDYYELRIPVSLTYAGNQQMIHLEESAKFKNIRYQIGGSNFEFWDVTNLFDVKNQLMYDESGSKYAIAQTNETRKRYVAFNSGAAKIPVYSGKVQNQNLHAYAPYTFLIISHPDFMAQANRLGDFHRSHYQQLVAVVNINEIYNEFGGGKKDATSIRDFIKMVYDRGQNAGEPLKYVLLFGDGTYDFKDRLDKNTNFIPTFQSRDSYRPSSSYASDDYFSILDDGEGYFDLLDAKEGVDIGVGRIPSRTLEQATTVVDKILGYHLNTSFGEWRNRLTFLADDEDGNTHFTDTEMVSGFVDRQNPVYNIEKIYMDAYKQESYGSGQKYPDVNLAIDRNFDRGQLVFNYLGHGGPSGMAHERVVTRDQIRNWNNIDKLSVIITATCELTRYDDPSQDSPGELALFNEQGGAVALITTTRLVYINLNRDLNAKIVDNNMFNISSGKPMLGDVFMNGKNRSQKNVNQRNFSLIGDPAMMMAYPKYQVVTTHINDSVIGSQSIDTFKAFSKMKITGEVRNEDGSLATNFNGIVYPTMYDKYQSYTTLGNDLSSSPRTFKMQNSALYRGKTSVVNGVFSFQFVVPKDIAYQYGKGKLNYYAEDGVSDGNGYDTSIMVGGSSSNIATDNKGPEINLFMDDYTFVFGGITNTKPLLLCKVYDENGINTVGNGIGRDITAIIDEGTDKEQILVLNDYYQSTLNSYQEGELRYNMETLSPGKHTLKVRVWDVYNNSSEDYTEFVVAGDEKLTLGHVLNYPNPFTTHTEFHFDHNKQGQQLDVQIQILTVTGKVVNNFSYNSISTDSHFNGITWNGLDAFGDRLARGVYLYKISAKSEDGDKAEVIEKLVLLK